MNIGKKLKLVLVATIVSASAIAMVGCTNKDGDQKKPAQEQSTKDKKEDANGSATKNNEEKVLVYYTYNINTEKLTSHEKKVDEIDINSVINALIEADVLPKGTKVNSFKIESKDKVKTMVVDVNEKFINTNQGSTAEILQLQCFANSLIKSFGVNNIRLTVQGENYSSGHIQLQDNQTLEFK